MLINDCPKVLIFGPEQRIFNMSLTKQELERYKRHTILPELGVRGQEMLKSASVLIVGTGGLGSPIAMYLAASGVGTIDRPDLF